MFPDIELICRIFSVCFADACWEIISRYFFEDERRANTFRLFIKTGYGNFYHGS